MSSILDALNKLEQDRAHAQRSSEGVGVDPVSAAQELIGPSVLRDRITIRFSPLTLILGGLACVLVLVSFSVAAALLIVRSSESDAATVTDAAAQGTAVAARDAAPGTTVPPHGGRVVDETGTMTSPSQEPPPEKALSSVVVAKTEAPEPSALEVPEDQPNAAAALTASTEAPKPAPAPETTSPPPQRISPEVTHMAEAEVTTPIRDVATAPGAVRRPGIVARQDRTPVPRPSIPEIRSTIERETVVGRAGPESPALSFKELPILTKTGQLRYADEPLMINMLKPASDTNPYGFTFINRIKVYEGQTIPGTELQLLGVELDGIAVIVKSSGQRYYINF